MMCGDRWIQTGDPSCDGSCDGCKEVFMREQFEAWWPSVGQTIGKAAAWEAWQAARAMPTQPGHVTVPASALAGVVQLAGYAVQYTDHDGQLRADFGVISDALQGVTP